MTDAIKRLEEFTNGMAAYWDEAPASLAKDNNGKMARLLRAAVSALQTGMCWEQLKTHMKLKCECPIGDFLTLIETELGKADEK